MEEVQDNRTTDGLRPMAFAEQRETTHLLQLCERVLADTCLIEVGLRGLDDLLDNSEVDVALSPPD